MENKNEDMYEILKNRIIQLEYAPGQVLNEKDIASEFNLSRTPVRRVFEQLKKDKLLNIIPRFGAQVAPIDYLYTKSVLEVSRELEAYAARLATERITDKQIEELEEIVEKLKTYDIDVDYKQFIIEDQKFHAIVFESSGNPCLIDILNGLHIHRQRMWHYAQPNITETRLFLDTLPNTIVALKEKNPDMASEFTKVHIDKFVDRVKQVLL